MAHPKRATNTSPSGRVLAGSAQVTRVPGRVARPRTEGRRAEQTAAIPTRTASAANTARKIPHLRKLTGKRALKKKFKKAFATTKAFAITATLLIPSMLQLVIAIGLAVAVGFFDIGFVAWATQNFGIIDYTAEALFGALWIISVALNLLMFLYSIIVFTLTGTNLFTPGALLALALCLACILMPVINIVPWVLVYVWVVAITR